MIYETDDDNAPNTDLTVFQHHPQRRGLIVNTKMKAYNPYVHFGQSSIWPRGFPLNFISEDMSHTYTLCSNLSEPLIKQGIVSGDPDVDAIFRLTRKHASKPIDLSYDDKARPVMLPKGVFSPYNSQNTMIDYQAFWSLVLPGSVNMRITDIWRAYWALKLIWSIGGGVSYYPGTTRQVRNSHSYLVDAYDEIALYTKTTQLVDFLSDWKCSYDNLLHCSMQLCKDIADRQFWGQADVELFKAFMQDLIAIGYKFPALSPSKPLCNTTKPETVTCYAQEQRSTTHVVPELTLTGLTQRKPLCSELNLNI